MGLPISFYSLQIADNTLKSNGEPEVTTFSVPITTLTPANVAATAGLTGTLASAIAGITIGQQNKNELVYQRNITNAGNASSNLAQRENKWLVRYHDQTTHEKFKASIGTADLTLLPSGSEFLDISTGVGATFKSAFEGVVVSPSDPSHLVTVDSVQFVGRNT